MNVLSLFDGMSCGQIALEELGFKIDKYFASEIDKFAIQQTQHNFPGTIQLGSVLGVQIKSLPKIDLLIGGSPCQGFSFAGKQLNFEDERSKLFFEFVRIKNELMEQNPNLLFLLENVNMKRKYLGIISEYLGVYPVRINSNLVSAQNRDRWYWTNIKTERRGLFSDIWSDIPQPEDKNILLKDILQPETEIDEKYYIKEKHQSILDLGSLKKTGQISFKKKGIENNKATTLLARDYKGISGIQYFNVCVTNIGRKIDENGTRKDYDKNIPYTREWQFNKNHKSNCLTSVQKDNLILHQIVRKVKVRKYDVDIESLKKCLQDHKIKSIREISEILNCEITKVQHWFRKENSFSIPNAKYWFQLKKILNIKTNEFDKSITEFEIKDSSFDQNNRAYNVEGKNPTLMAAKKDNIVTNGYKLRRLTPIECARLQTIPAWYEWIVSDTQIYKMLGNGWTIEVIKHIFSFINES